MEKIQKEMKQENNGLKREINTHYPVILAATTILTIAITLK